MNIKIVGSNCKNGMQLYKMASRAVEELEENIEVEKLDDKNSINKYGVKNIPGLIINNRLVSEGKVLTSREITKLLA
ncbi:MAG: thioredoxin family protein [Clostridia bacterium]|nr:redox-active disulfide protein 2 [Clostridium sp. CAG:571]HJJ06835.1 thioredoxin family protein [Clostridiaceae bacterium]HJJ13655.1 thioredoxin family protein [Clostridiaceae bacterium]